MSFNKNKYFAKRSYPDHLAPDEVKETDEYGLQMAKMIEKEWFYRPQKGACGYYDKRTEYHKLRLYARGEQPTEIYKKLLNLEDDSSYANYDFRPLQIVPKFLNLIVNQMTERLFSVKAEATDKFSSDLKDTHKKNLEKIIISKPAVEEAKKTLGIDLSPQDPENYPETQEEIDLFMRLKYKPAIEIATEEAIKFTLDVNDYDQTQSKVIEDVATIGIGAIKHGTDPSKGITVEYVDPADMVYSNASHRDFKDVTYYGEVKRMSINELKRISNGALTKEELEKIGKSTNEWANHHNVGTNQNYTEGDLEGSMADVLFFNFKSTNTLTYKKKYNRGGGFKMIKKKSTFNKPNDKYDGYDVVKKVIDVWYEGALVLGTDKLFNYKLCENMIRPKGYLNITSPNYLVYAPEMYENRTKSLVGRVVLYVDQMQQVHIKMQQIIAKARPSGIWLDVAGMNEVDLGDGNFLTPLEQVKIYNETGNAIGSSLTHEGEFNYGREAIKELKNDIGAIDKLIIAYNHYMSLLRDAIGIPQGADATNPHPDTLVGVQNQVATNSNTATRHILDSCLNITERLGKSLVLRMKDIFLYSDLKNVYINAVGKINVKTLEAIKQFHLHDLGLNIELRPDTEEKQYLEINIGKALDKELITLDDAIDIRNIDNIKLANELLKTRRLRREKKKIQHEKEMEQIRAEGQAMIVERASAAKAQELKAKEMSDLAVVAAKSQAKQKELEKEGDVKLVLMAKEFEYQMKLQGEQIKVDNMKSDKDHKQKMARQDRNNTQDSEKITQRTFNQPSKSFESAEDNISGSVELGEVGLS